MEKQIEVGFVEMLNDAIAQGMRDVAAGSTERDRQVMLQRLFDTLTVATANTARLYNLDDLANALQKDPINDAIVAIRTA